MNNSIFTKVGEEIEEYRNLIQDCTDSIRRIEKLEDTIANQKRIYDLRKEREEYRRKVAELKK